MNKANDTDDRAKVQGGAHLKVWFGKMCFNGNDFEKPKILSVVVTEECILSYSDPTPTSSNTSPSAQGTFQHIPSVSQRLPMASEGLHGLTVLSLLLEA